MATLTDEFDYADGRLQTVSGGLWQDSGTGWQVSSGQVSWSINNSAGYALHTEELDDADHWARVAVNIGASEYAGGGVILRAGGTPSAPTGWRVELGYWQGARRVGITRLDGASSTEVHTAAAGGTGTGELEAHVEGTTITVYVDGQLATSYTGATQYATQLGVGLYAGRWGGSAVTIDAFAAGREMPPPPGPPRNLTATPGTEEVALDWDEPEPGELPVTDYVVQYREAEGVSAEGAWSETFDDLGSGDFAFLPRAGWVTNGADAAVRVFNGDAGPPWGVLSVLYFVNTDQHVARDVGSPDHRVSARWKLGSGNVVGGLVAKRKDATHYLGFELVLHDGMNGIPPEDKLVVYLRDGDAHDEFFTLWDAGLTHETWYDLDLEYVGGRVRAWLDSELVCDVQLTPEQAAIVDGATYAGAINFAGTSNYDTLSAVAITPGGEWQTFPDGISTETSAVVTGLVDGKPYDFRVAAVNDTGQGEWSEVVSATPGGSSELAAAIEAEGASVTAVLGTAPPATDIDPTGTVVAAVAGTATVTATTQVTPTPTVVEATTVVATVTATGQVAPAATVVAARTAVATVTATTEVDPTAAVVAAVAAVADVDTAPQVDPVATVVAAVSATSVVTATGQVAPAATVVAAHTAVAVVTATTQVNPTGTVVAAVAGTATVISGAAVVPVTATVATTTGVATVTATTEVDPTPTVVAAVAGTAGVTATAQVNPAPTVVAAVCAVAAVALNIALDRWFATTYRERSYATPYRRHT